VRRRPRRERAQAGGCRRTDRWPRRLALFCGRLGRLLASRYAGCWPGPRRPLMVTVGLGLLPCALDAKYPSRKPVEQRASAGTAALVAPRLPAGSAQSGDSPEVLISPMR